MRCKICGYNQKRQEVSDGLIYDDCFEKHHIIPKSKGGKNNKENLINICVKCHRKLHNIIN